MTSKSDQQILRNIIRCSPTENSCTDLKSATFVELETTLTFSLAITVGEVNSFLPFTQFFTTRLERSFWPVVTSGM